MMVQRFLEYIKNQKLFVPSQKILLAISGGIDSMVMVSLFSKAKFNFGIAHCNFMLRGSESEEDAAFVKNTALKLGVGYFEKSFETSEIALSIKQSIQVTARELRYEWFNQLIIENRYDYFATAHQFDDQTETFFINLFRGTGISGLRGILPKNGNCVRPLLFACREEIREFAAENGVSFREDSSNKSDKYLRNKIRHEVIPAMEKVYPDFRKGFLKTFKNLAEAEKFVANKIKTKSQELIFEDKGLIKISLINLQNIDPLTFHLHEILKPYHFNFSTVEDICAVMDKIAGKMFFSPTHCLKGTSRFLTIEPLKNATFEDAEEFSIGEHIHELKLPVNLSFEIVDVHEQFIIQKNKSIAQLDFGKLIFPLKLRKWKQGDQFMPLGMKGNKLLSDYFVDEKFSVDEKHRIWLLVSGQDIVWIVGHRISDSYKITKKTKNVLIIKLV